MKSVSTSLRPVKGKSGLVIVLVVLGIGVLGAGGYLAWSKRQAGAAPGGSGELTRWCELRQEWARKVDPLGADILLKSVKPEDKNEADKLALERNKLCSDFARRVRAMGIEDPGIGAVEAALIKEGKVRANIAVEIYNLSQKLSESDDTPVLSKTRDMLKIGMLQRIQQGKQNADKEVAAAMASLKGSCPKIFRGPAAETGTAESPYVTWDEVDLQRSTAITRFAEKIKQLEPQEEFTNRVYHEVIRQHRPFITSCHKRASARNPSLSKSIGLQIRLKRSGEVKTLAIAEGNDEKDFFLDCLNEKAAKWKLPKPDAKTEVVVVTIDFSKL